MARPFFTYMLRCSDQSYYVGHTDELERRVEQHMSGLGSGYTATRQPVRLVWSEEFPTREEAKVVEAQLRNGAGARKKH